MMGCICNAPGYCILRQTMMYTEEFKLCQTNEAWRASDLLGRGIRNYEAVTKVFERHLGVATPAVACEPCEEKSRPKKSTVARFQSTRPVVVNRRQTAALGLRDQYLGQRVFLLGGGPSLKSVNLSLLQRPGVTIAAMNNAATVVRPHIWFGVDPPRNFHETIWRDPSVMKFTLDKYLKDERQVEAWSEEANAYRATGLRINDCPNVYGFDHRHDWDASLFLDDTVPSWGANEAHQDPEGKSKRVSVMLPSLWLLYWLGFRVIYLLGCDFRVGDGSYAFDEKCGRENDTLFQWLDRRFKELLPHARERGLTILNCTEGSALTAFEKISLDSALEATLESWPATIVTRGHYRNP